MRVLPTMIKLKDGRFAILSGTSQKFEKVVPPEEPRVTHDEAFPFPPPVGNIGYIPLYNLLPSYDAPSDAAPRAIVDAEDFARLRKRHWTGIRRKLATQTVIRVWTQLNGNRNAEMGRIVMGVTDPNLRVRHLNHNPLDNRKCNLSVGPRWKQRQATSEQLPQGGAAK